MKTFLIVLGVLLLAVVLADVAPVLVIPLGAGLGVALLLGSIIAGIAAVVIGALLIALLAVGGVVVGLLSATAPVWIPIAVILGIIALVRRTNAPTSA